MAKKSSVSVIIPTLNEANNIGTVIKGIKGQLSGRRYDIIIVDGYSSDKTIDIAKKHGARVLLDRRGKGSALMKGLSAAKNSILVSMDADLSHEPKELTLLIDGIEAGYDICMGSRFITGGSTEDMSPVRIIGNKLFVFLVNTLFGSNYSDMCYGYRSFRKSVLRKLGLTEEGFGIETEISIKAAKRHIRVMEIPSNEKQRNSGEAKLKTFEDGYVIMKTILKNLFSS